MNMSSLWNRSGNEMSDATTIKNTNEAEFPHQRISRFYAAAEVANTKDPWDNSSPDQQANGKGSTDGEPLTRRIFSDAETHRNYSESEDAYGKQAYEAANVEGAANGMSDATTIKNRDEKEFPHQKISRFYAAAEVANIKDPWDNSPADQQANVEGSADGEPLTRRIFSAAETHRNYSESEDAFGKQAYEAANVKGAANGGEPNTHRIYSAAEPHTQRIFSAAETHRSYSESEDAYGKQAYEAANIEGGAAVKKIVTRAAAGIGTNIENYEDARTQRRQYSEATADDVIDVNEEIDATNVPTEAEEDEIWKIEEAARVIKEAEEDKVKEIKEAARVEKKIVEECEGVLSQRRHFRGSTTSNIFN